MGILSIQNGSLLMDGHPYQLVSGAIHYFRVVPEYWRDRLLKLRACGFNAVKTVIPWNLHECANPSQMPKMPDSEHRILIVIN